MASLDIKKPIQVYCYDRHKKPSDRDAVRSVGFYDKRTVVEETKHQQFYVMAYVHPSIQKFKEEQQVRVGVYKDRVQEEIAKSRANNTNVDLDALKNIKASIVMNDGTYVHENKYDYSLKKYLKQQKERREKIIYIPVKNYKPFVQKFTESAKAAIAFSKRDKKWILYSGRTNTCDIFFATEAEDKLDYAFYVTADRRNNPEKSEKQFEETAQQIIEVKAEEITDWPCEDVKGYYILTYSSFIVVVGNYLWNNPAVVGSLAVALNVSTLAAALFDFILMVVDKTGTLLGYGQEPSGAGLTALVALASVAGLGYNVFRYLVEYLSPNVVVPTIPTNIIDTNSGNTYIEFISFFKTAVKRIISLDLPLVLNFFWEQINAASAPNVGLAFINLFVSGAFLQTSVGKYIYKKIQDTMCGLARLVKGLVECITTRDLKPLKDASLSALNFWRYKHAEPLILKDYASWKEAKDILEESYGDDIEIKVSKKPRLMMLPSVKASVVVEGGKVENKTVRFSGNYVYVVASTETAWFFYDNDYNVVSDDKFFKIYMVDRLTGDGKQTLSDEVPVKAGGDYCAIKIKNVIVSGVPFHYYVVGCTVTFGLLTPIFLDKLANAVELNRMLDLSELPSSNNPFPFSWESILKVVRLFSTLSGQNEDFNRVIKIKGIEFISDFLGVGVLTFGAIFMLKNEKVYKWLKKYTGKKISENVQKVCTIVKNIVNFLPCMVAIAIYNGLSLGDDRFVQWFLNKYRFT